MPPPVITLKRARRFRKNLTPPELGLWLRLKNRQLGGYHFRRQHPIGPYILDFYCAAAKLAIEVDGYSHGVGDAPAHDARRDAWLAGQGIGTFRISADLAKDPDAAAATILDVVRPLAPSTATRSPSTATRSPSPAARERSQRN
jgi:very-short-patch-repair endonuclease